MGNFRYIIIMAATVGTLMSCRTETPLTPSDQTTNYFEVPASANSESDILRREFHDRTGIYLLFTDTLRHEYQGLDGNGASYYIDELVDLAYGITVNSKTYYAFRYTNEIDERRKWATYVEQQIVPLMDKKPYSILLVDRIYEYAYLGDDLYNRTEQSMFDGYRCYAMSIDHITEIYDEIYYSSMVTTIKTDSRIKSFLEAVDPDNLLGVPTDIPEEFSYDNFYSEDVRVYGYDSQFLTYIRVPYNEERPLFYLPLCWAKGYLAISFVEDFYGDYYYAHVGTSDEEIREFVKLLKTKTYDQIEALYGAYPFIMQKCRIMRTIMESLDLL